MLGGTCNLDEESYTWDQWINCDCSGEASGTYHSGYHMSEYHVSNIHGPCVSRAVSAAKHTIDDLDMFSLTYIHVYHSIADYVLTNIDVFSPNHVHLPLFVSLYLLFLNSPIIMFAIHLPMYVLHLLTCSCSYIIRPW